MRPIVLRFSLPGSGYKFTVCADLVQHRLIASVISLADSQYTSAACRLEGFQLVNDVGFDGP